MPAVPTEKKFIIYYGIRDAFQKKMLRRSILIYPPPPSCNRDKLQLSGGELINIMWPLLIFSVKSSTLLNDIENLHYVRPQKMLQIVWKQKHQSEHGTCDKKILTPPSIRIFPLFGELKKGDFFTPLPLVWTKISFSAIFFGRHPLEAWLEYVDTNIFSQDRDLTSRKVCS